MPMMYGGYGMWGFGSVFMMLVFLGFIGLVVYWAANSAVKNALKSGSSSALEILKIRYAKNEITAEEYRKMQEDLTR